MRYQISGTVHVKDRNQGIVLVKDMEKDQGMGLPKLLQKNILKGQLVEDGTGSVLLPAKYDVANIHF